MILMMEDDKPIVPKFCGSCGKTLLQGATYCAYCGATVPDLSSPLATRTKPTPDSSPSPGSYPPPYYQKPVTDPPLPFFQHFQGVLISPQEEMVQITKKPNLRQPFVVVIIAGIIAGLALFIYFSKIIPMLEYTPEFYQSLGIPSDQLGGININDFINMSFMFSALLSPIEFLISWIISSVFLWVLLALLGSHISSHERNFKISATIVGWSFLPRIFEESINLIYNLVIVQAPSSPIEVSDFAEIATITAVGSSDLFNLLFLFTSLIFLIWSVVLVFFAIRSFNLEASRAVVIAISYAVINYVFPILFALPFL